MCQSSTEVCTARGQQVSFLLLHLGSESEPGHGGQVKVKGVHLLPPVALGPVNQADGSRIETTGNEKTSFLLPSDCHSRDTVCKGEWRSNWLPTLATPDHHFAVPAHLRDTIGRCQKQFDKMCLPICGIISLPP